MKKIRVGLAGYGYWGPNLARAIEKITSAELSAIADLNKARLKDALRDCPKTICYESISSMIASGEIDAIVIATPAKTHDRFAEEAIEHGLHVLVEKPMTLDPSTGSKISKVASKKNLIYMPGHTFVYNDAVRWAKSYINSGSLGVVLNIYSQRLNLGQLRQDINVVWNLAPHDISIFDYLLNSRVLSVSATGSAITNSGIEDVAFISMIYENGVIAHSHVSWLDPTKTRKITVIGNKGMIVIDDINVDARIQIHEKFAFQDEQRAPYFGELPYSLKSGGIEIPKLNIREPLQVEIEDFVTAIQNGSSPLASSSDGIWVAKVLKAIDQSIKEGGHPIALQ